MRKKNSERESKPRERATARERERGSDWELWSTGEKEWRAKIWPEVEGRVRRWLSFPFSVCTMMMFLPPLVCVVGL
jgi:hypothetical protein